MLPGVFLGLMFFWITYDAWAQRGSFVPVEQEISAQEVLQLVDASYPGLQAFGGARAAGDWAQAQQLLIQHFATRTKPVIPPPTPGAGGNSMLVLSKATPEQAEKWLKHIFTLANNDIGRQETYELGPKIDWLKNPSSAPSWLLYLHQLNHLNALAGLYKDTKDERLATEIGQSVLSWAQQVPVCFGRLEKDGSIIPSGMEVRNRLCNLLVTYDVVRSSPSLTPEMHMAFWKIFIASARYLLTYEGVTFPGLIPAAVWLPEFREAKQWLAAGEKNLRFCLVNRVSPEGAWDTQSISYQTVPATWAERTLEILQANDEGENYQPLAQLIRQQIGKILGLLLWIVMPNGGQPNVGDTYGRCDWNDSVTQNVLRAYIRSQFAPDQQQKLNAIKNRYERLKAALALSEGREGPEPARASIAFVGSGYYVMRSGWEAQQARYLYFDLTPQGMGHAHNDACHFDLYAYGKPLLVDTGDYFLGWGYRAALHNTIEVDGRDQARGAKAPMLPCDWASTPAFDLVEGAHGAYEDLGVIHRRKILYVKGQGRAPDYYMLWDCLSGTGEHTSEQFFHFAGPTQTEPAQAQLHPDTLAAYSTHENTANIHILPVLTEGVQAEFVQAQDTDMNPKDMYERKAMLGWIVTSGTFQRVKAPVLAYKRTGPLPHCYGDVLFPVPAGAELELKATALPVREKGQPVGPEIASGIQIDWRLTKPKYAEEQLQPQMGPNLALGKTGFAEINQGNIAATTALLTDGDEAEENIGGGLCSHPHIPDVLLEGRFGVDLGQETEINMLVVHHGVWNGQQILYVPDSVSVQYWEAGAWREAPAQKIVWLRNTVSQILFAPVRTTRISVVVRRKEGGRLAMREMEAYYVPEAEWQRIEAMRKERETQEGSDIVLVSHNGLAERTYGPARLQGELAIIRRNARGEIIAVAVRETTQLEIAGQTFKWPAAVPFWQGTKPPAFFVGGAPPQIKEPRVQLQPAQEGFNSAQPSALISFTTDRPCRAYVCFTEPGVGQRRTPLTERLSVTHAIPAYFLRPDRSYEFRLVAIDEKGLRAEASVRP